jgi:iron complex outermembrane receptor protein
MRRFFSGFRRHDAIPARGWAAFNPKLPEYQLINLRVGIARASWEVALFVNNLTNERALLSLDRERGTRARVGYLTNQPRMLGLTMTFSY